MIWHAIHHRSTYYFISIYCIYIYCICVSYKYCNTKTHFKSHENYDIHNEQSRFRKPFRANHTTVFARHCVANLLCAVCLLCTPFTLWLFKCSFYLDFVHAHPPNKYHTHAFANIFVLNWVIFINLSHLYYLQIITRSFHTCSKLILFLSFSLALRLHVIFLSVRYLFIYLFILTVLWRFCISMRVYLRIHILA